MEPKKDSISPQQYLKQLEAYFEQEKERTRTSMTPQEQNQALVRGMLNTWEEYRAELAKKDPKRGNTLLPIQQECISFRTQLGQVPFIQLTTDQVINELKIIFLTEDQAEKAEKKFLETQQGNSTLHEYILNFSEAACVLQDMNITSKYNTPEKKIKTFIMGLREDWRKTVLNAEDNTDWVSFFTKMKRAALKEEAQSASQTHTTVAQASPSTHTSIQSRLGAGSSTLGSRGNAVTTHVAHHNTTHEAQEKVLSQTHGLIPLHLDKDGTYSVMSWRSKQIANRIRTCLQCGENDHYKYTGRNEEKGCPFGEQEAIQMNLGQASETDVRNGFDFNKRNDYIHEYKMARYERSKATKATIAHTAAAQGSKRPLPNPNSEPLAKTARTVGAIPSRLTYPQQEGYPGPTVRMASNTSGAGNA
jgi:hypothetical protein